MFIRFVVRVCLWSCPRINTHSQNVLVYLLEELLPIRIVMWLQIRYLNCTKKSLHALIRSIQKGFDACSNDVIFSTDLYYILDLGFLMFGAQPCPYWDPSNCQLPVFFCMVMIHTKPPTYCFDQPRTINPPTTSSWTPCHCIMFYIIPWVVKSIRKLCTTWPMYWCFQVYRNIVFVIWHSM